MTSHVPKIRIISVSCAFETQRGVSLPLHDRLSLGSDRDVSQSRFRFKAPLRAACAEVNNQPTMAIGKQHSASWPLGPTSLIVGASSGSAEGPGAKREHFCPIVHRQLLVRLEITGIV